MSEPKPTTHRGALVALFLVGFGLEALLWTRGWIYGDQAKLLSLGQYLAVDGDLLPTTGELSAGLRSPGSLLQLLVGLPLEVWYHYRAPVLVAQLLHLGAVALLARTLFRAVGGRQALIFLALYWYSPWFMYHAGFLWEPSYLVLPAAVHLWACHRLRTERAFWPSAALAGAIVCAAQIHPSALVLAIAAAVLAVRRRISIHGWGAAAGAALGSVTLVPLAWTILSGAGGWSPLGTAGSFRPFASLVRGLAYWFRLGSADAGSHLRESIASRAALAEGASSGGALLGLFAVVAALAAATVVVSLVANWWYFRPHGPDAGKRADTPDSWLRVYAGSCLIAVLVASALSPSVIQSWDLVIVLHATCLPVAGWIDTGWRHRVGRRRLFGGLIALRLVAVLLIGLYHPMYVTPSKTIRWHAMPDHFHPLLSQEREPGAEP